MYKKASLQTDSISKNSWLKNFLSKATARTNPLRAHFLRHVFSHCLMTASMMKYTTEIHQHLSFVLSPEAGVNL